MYKSGQVIILHQPEDFPEIFGDFPKPKSYLLGGKSVVFEGGFQPAKIQIYLKHVLSCTGEKAIYKKKYG